MPAHTYRQRGGIFARWQPASLITGDVIAIKLTLGVWALVRAEDYAHGVKDRFPLLEAAFPMWAWMTWAWAVGTCILAGIAWQRHVVVWLGHALGSGLYAVLTLTQLAMAFEKWPPAGVVVTAIPPIVWVLMLAGTGVAVASGAVAARGQLASASWVAAILGLAVVSVIVALGSNPADGIRGAGPLATMSLLHGVLALRSGPRPLTDDETCVVESTSAQDGR